MASKSSEQKTIDYYDQNALAWAATHGGNEEISYWHEEMEYFHQLLPTGNVLEIGTGAGKDAAALITMGYAYTGTDASKGLLQIAQKRCSEARFKHLGVCDLDFPKHSFDGFWTAATLLHLPKSEIDKALQSIKTQVKPEGIGFISMKAGAGEREDPKTGRWFAYYSQENFKDILERNGFKVIKSKTRKENNGYWLCYWVRA